MSDKKNEIKETEISYNDAPKGLKEKIETAKEGFTKYTIDNFDKKDPQPKKEKKEVAYKEGNATYKAEVVRETKVVRNDLDFDVPDFLKNVSPDILDKMTGSLSGQQAELSVRENESKGSYFFPTENSVFLVATTPINLYQTLDSLNPEQCKIMGIDFNNKEITNGAQLNKLEALCYSNDKLIAKYFGGEIDKNGKLIPESVPIHIRPGARSNIKIKDATIDDTEKKRKLNKAMQGSRNFLSNVCNSMDEVACLALRVEMEKAKKNIPVNFNVNAAKTLLDKHLANKEKIKNGGKINKEDEITQKDIDSAGLFGEVISAVIEEKKTIEFAGKKNFFDQKSGVNIDKIVGTSNSYNTPAAPVSRLEKGGIIKGGPVATIRGLEYDKKWTEIDGVKVFKVKTKDGTKNYIKVNEKYGSFELQEVKIREQETRPDGTILYQKGKRVDEDLENKIKNTKTKIEENGTFLYNGNRYVEGFIRKEIPNTNPKKYNLDKKYFVANPILKTKHEDVEDKHHDVPANLRTHNDFSHVINRIRATGNDDFSKTFDEILQDPRGFKERYNNRHATIETNDIVQSVRKVENELDNTQEINPPLTPLQDKIDTLNNNKVELAETYMRVKGQEEILKAKYEEALKKTQDEKIKRDTEIKQLIESNIKEVADLEYRKNEIQEISSNIKDELLTLQDKIKNESNKDSENSKNLLAEQQKLIEANKLLAKENEEVSKKIDETNKKIEDCNNKVIEESKSFYKEKTEQLKEYNEEKMKLQNELVTKQNELKTKIEDGIKDINKIARDNQQKINDIKAKGGTINPAINISEYTDFDPVKASKITSNDLDKSFKKVKDENGIPNNITTSDNFIKYIKGDDSKEFTIGELAVASVKSRKDTNDNRLSKQAEVKKLNVDVANDKFIDTLNLSGLDEVEPNTIDYPGIKTIKIDPVKKAEAKKKIIGEKINPVKITENGDDEVPDVTGNVLSTIDNSSKSISPSTLDVTMSNVSAPNLNKIDNINDLDFSGNSFGNTGPSGLPVKPGDNDKAQPINSINAISDDIKAKQTELAQIHILLRDEEFKKKQECLNIYNNIDNTYEQAKRDCEEVVTGQQLEKQEILKEVEALQAEKRKIESDVGEDKLKYAKKYDEITKQLQDLGIAPDSEEAEQKYQEVRELSKQAAAEDEIIKEKINAINQKINGCNNKIEVLNERTEQTNNGLLKLEQELLNQKIDALNKINTPESQQRQKALQERAQVLHGEIKSKEEEAKKLTLEEQQKFKDKCLQYNKEVEDFNKKNGAEFEQQKQDLIRATTDNYNNWLSTTKSNVALIDSNIETYNKYNDEIEKQQAKEQEQKSQLEKIIQENKDKIGNVDINTSDKKIIEDVILQQQQKLDDIENHKKELEQQKVDATKKLEDLKKQKEEIDVKTGASKKSFDDEIARLNGLTSQNGGTLQTMSETDIKNSNIPDFNSPNYTEKRFKEDFNKLKDTHPLSISYNDENVKHYNDGLVALLDKKVLNQDECLTLDTRGVSNFLGLKGQDENVIKMEEFIDKNGVSVSSLDKSVDKYDEKTKELNALFERLKTTLKEKGLDGGLGNIEYPKIGKKDEKTNQYTLPPEPVKGGLLTGIGNKINNAANDNIASNNTNLPIYFKRSVVYEPEGKENYNAADSGISIDISRKQLSDGAYESRNTAYNDCKQIFHVLPDHVEYNDLIKKIEQQKKEGKEIDSADLKRLKDFNTLNGIKGARSERDSKDYKQAKQVITEVSKLTSSEEFHVGLNNKDVFVTNKFFDNGQPDTSKLYFSKDVNGTHVKITDPNEMKGALDELLEKVSYDNGTKKGLFEMVADGKNVENYESEVVLAGFRQLAEQLSEQEYRAYCEGLSPEVKKKLETYPQEVQDAIKDYKQVKTFEPQSLKNRRNMMKTSEKTNTEKQPQPQQQQQSQQQTPQTQDQKSPPNALVGIKTIDEQVSKSQNPKDILPSKDNKEQGSVVGFQ